MSDRAGVAAVNKAGHILQSFTAVRPVQSLRQIESRTGIPRATAHGICVALVETGLLEVVPNQGYQLGSAFIGLGGQVIERTGLLDAAKDVGKRLVHLDNTEAHLAQLVGGWLVYLDRTASKHKLPMNVHMGSRQLAHLSDGGRAALSLMRPDDVWRTVQAACRSEDREPPDRIALLDDLAAVRRAGYARADHPRIGRASIGMAIVTSAGQPVGAVSISGPADLFANRQSFERLVGALQMMSATISRRLPLTWS